MLSKLQQQPYTLIFHLCNLVWMGFCIGAISKALKFPWWTGIIAILMLIPVGRWVTQLVCKTSDPWDFTKSEDE